ncbi:MAG: GntR family transcriptional regulator [Anaerolineales bacterium]
MVTTSRSSISRPGPRIDRSSALPYYVQLKEALTEGIRSGRWKPGERLPSEPELCQSFDVSRTVVRQALQDLVYEGVVVREKGRGTFVAEAKISSTSLVHSLIGFHQDMAERGFEPYSKVLEQVMMPATLQVARYLHLEELNPVIKLERLRFIHEDPIVLVTSYLPYEICPLAVTADFTRQSLYAFLAETYAIALSRGRRRIEATVANEELAELFRIEPGAPLLRMESVTFSEHDRPIEYFVGFFRGDRSRFEVEVLRFGTKSDPSHLDPLQMDEDWLAR